MQNSILPIDACFKVDNSTIISAEIIEKFSGVVVTSDTNPLNNEKRVERCYKQLISSLPDGSTFKIFMTLDVSLHSNHKEIVSLCLEKFFPLFRLFEENKIPLYISPKSFCDSNKKVISEEKKEKSFIKHSLPKIINNFPNLILILEDITTKKGINFVSNVHPSEKKIYAIISPLSLKLAEKAKNTHEVLNSPHFRFFFGTVKNDKADYSMEVYKSYLKASLNTQRLEYLMKKFTTNFQILFKNPSDS